MHKMSHVVNKLNGLSDFASVGTFYALLIESSDVYSEYDLQIMHFIAVILGQQCIEKVFSTQVEVILDYVCNVSLFELYIVMLL